MFFHLIYGIKRRIHTRASNEGKVSRNRNRIISFSVKMNVLSILQSFSPKQTICSVHFAASLTHNFWDRNFNEKSSNAFSSFPKRSLSLSLSFIHCLSKQFLQNSRKKIRTRRMIPYHWYVAQLLNSEYESSPIVYHNLFIFLLGFRCQFGIFIHFSHYIFICNHQMHSFLYLPLPNAMSVNKCVFIKANKQRRKTFLHKMSFCVPFF